MNKVETCRVLRNLELPQAEITDVQPIEAGDFIAPDGSSYAVPAFYRVQVVAKPTIQSCINFEVWLPLDSWNGRYHQYGEGGESGFINYAALAESLNANNAVATTDDGHSVAAPLATTPNMSWALNQPEKVIDWGYRAQKLTSDHARHIIRACYGDLPHHAYFSGASGGGRHGAMAVQRYPEDWDGVVIGAAGRYFLWWTCWSNLWRSKLWAENPEGRIPLSKFPAIRQAALAACTEDAHVVEGIAGDPRFCQFDPATLLCQGSEADDCLTSAQVEILRKILNEQGISPRGGKMRCPIAPTVEVDGWGLAKLFGASPSDNQTDSMKNALGIYRYMVFDNPELELQSLDLERDFAQAVNRPLLGETLSSVLDAGEVDLSAFRDRGGKILEYHGWADHLPPMVNIAHYESVAAAMGGLDSIQDFYRLFMVPGMLHCNGGPGANAFGQPYAWETPALKNDADHNIMRALEYWVEEGLAPDKIIATKYVDDAPDKGVEMTRPLYPYPQVAKYKGHGGSRMAENFEPVINPRALDSVIR